MRDQEEEQNAHNTGREKDSQETSFTVTNKLFFSKETISRSKSGKYKTGGTSSQIVLVTVAHLIENVLPLSAVLI